PGARGGIRARRRALRAPQPSVYAGAALGSPAGGCPQAHLRPDPRRDPVAAGTAFRLPLPSALPPCVRPLPRARPRARGGRTVAPARIRTERKTLIKPSARQDPPGGHARLVLDSPHTGPDSPADFAPAVPMAALRNAEDSYVHELYSRGPAVGATLIAARFPR